jgi:hypothetical protein
MFRGPVWCHFIFATYQTPTLRWYDAVIFMLFNIITAQTPLIIERKQPRKFDFATSAIRKEISIV